MKKAVLNNKGFSLVELLMVAGMMGIVMGAIFTIYQTHQRSAYTQEEVVEVQQNLRIAMDSITRDIRMAGFLTPLPQTVTSPLNAATANSLTINTGAEGGKYARITSVNQIVNLLLNDVVNLSVDSLNAFDSSDAGTLVVRIIRPQDNSQAVPIFFTVTGVHFSTVCGASVAPCLVLKANAAGTGNINTGDIIAGTTNATSDTITYSVITGTGGTCPVGQSCIQRTANGTGNVVANNITNLQFSYILDGGTEPDPATLTAAQMSQIRAVRVTITGQTVTTTALSGGVAKTRQIASIVRIRNRRL